MRERRRKRGKKVRGEKRVKRERKFVIFSLGLSRCLGGAHTCQSNNLIFASEFREFGKLKWGWSVKDCVFLYCLEVLLEFD